MSQEKLNSRQILILAFVSLCAPTGDACLSRGMSHLAPLSLAHPLSILAAVFTPWIALGILLLIGFFASYLTALSWADLTYVLPATASGNIIMTLFSKFWLHEAVSWQRWFGVLLITAGVGYVSRGPALTTPAEESKQEDAR